MPPQMNAWRRAQELTRKAEEEAMMAEKKSQEAYIWYVRACNRVSNVGHDTFLTGHLMPFESELSAFCKADFANVELVF